MNTTPISAKPDTFAHFSGLLASIAQYLKARLALLSAEGKNAGVNWGAALALLLGGLFIAILGYVLLIITAVFAIAVAWEWPHTWIVVLGIAALLHLGGALTFVSLARRKIKGGAFEGTIEELKKDQKWLTQLTNTN